MTNITDPRRWMVVDKNRTPIYTGMYSEANAWEEAERLNAEGLEEFRPYRVVLDVVAASIDDDEDDAYLDRLQMWEENEAENREAEWARPGWADR